MKKYILLFILVTFSFASGVISCSDSETRLNSVLNQATVVINLGMPEEHASAPTSVMDRIFHLFIRDAVAQTAPPVSIRSITVRVTGPDITTIEKSFISSGTVSLEVPAGSMRGFDVTAYVDPADPGAAASFRGMAVANLPAGATVNIPIVMRLNETKIIVPDYYNDRLLVLDSVSGSYVSEYGTSFIGDYNITPYDIDFDSKGRMYISDHYNNDIVRVNSFSLADGAVPHYVWFNVTATPNAIAVDRINNIVYFTDNTSLYRTNLDGDSLPAMPIDTITYIYGIDVGPDGSLYIAGTTSNYGPGIFKYNATSGTVVGYYTDTNINTPYDVHVKYPFIYVLTRWGIASEYNVVKLLIGNNNELTLIGHGPDQSIGTLNNVGHFTSLFSNGILMMGKYPDILVFMNNESGLGWQENSGSISDPFNFYDYGGGG